MNEAMLFKLPSIFAIHWINSIENFSGEKKGPAYKMGYYLQT